MISLISTKGTIELVSPFDTIILLVVRNWNAKVHVQVAFVHDSARISIHTCQTLQVLSVLSAYLYPF
jgi:hypothetical protein